MASVNRGDRLAGRFLLVRPLGATGHSWAADDVLAGERCALKLSADAATRAVLECEATLLERAAHPGVVRLIGCFEHAGERVLATEYLAGGDLSTLRGRPWREIAVALEPALAALEHLAQLGIAHGDLKPANLARGADGATRLIDFGVAAATAAGARARGSPYSRSPQQAEGAAPTPADDAYGLGALLYELLTGAPPGYPGDPVADASPRPLTAPSETPAELAELIARLLDPDPAIRPGPTAVRRTFERLHSALPAADPEAPVLAPPPGPTAATTWTPAVAARPLARERGGRPRGPVLAAALLAAAAAVVFWLLPRWTRLHPPEVTVAPAAPSPILAARSASAPRALPTTAEGLAALAEAKTGAEEARARYAAAHKAAEDARAELWGGDDWNRLAQSAAAAARQYEDRDYAAAARTWNAATELANRVRAGRGAAFAMALAAGKTAFERGAAPAAITAYERALAIQPGERAAAAGLVRAQHLDQVLAMLDAGAALERAGNVGEAAGRYRAALALDPATPAASSALVRLAARERAAAFAAAMASGQKQLATGARNGAREAFKRAAAIEPSAPAAREALAQLDGLDRNAAIARLQFEAQTAIGAERWADALSAYERALALDTTLAFAHSGSVAVTPRAALAARLEGYLARPEQLYAREGREAARTTLADAQAATPSPGPVLRSQIDRLGRALRAAETPVRVPLASDSLTDVVVYRVGRLGSFAAREIELLPGQYTIVGTRPGYRDVRRELQVTPGAALTTPVDVRCSEPI